MSEAPAIVLLCTDLMMTSTISGAAGRHGLRIQPASSAQDLRHAGDNDLILIDLATPGLDIHEAGSLLSDRHRQTAVTWGPHVHVDRFQQAEAAGFCNRLARGAFNANVVQLIDQFAASISTD